jgi:hypothetical protein
LGKLAEDVSTFSGSVEQAMQALQATMPCEIAHVDVV